MADDVFEARYLDEFVALTLAQVGEAAGLTADEVRELIEAGLLAPSRAAPTAFDARAVVVAREASRVRREFALDDVHSVCVVMRLVERVHGLERELTTLRARLGPG